ncbi:hypothetical protein FO519_000854 [Halicephalobus sp. NKZ332]|nr:hypothetical protein FO519_000854 [Halicephalobus sp. NKZ332]
MKALILAGGYGTRLRPLTLTQPKPLVEFANKSIVVHQLEALAAVRVDTAILALSYRADQVENEVQKHANRLGIRIIFSVEDEPLCTAGPIALARDYLNDSEPFFILNSDVICSFPFAEMMAFHKKHGREGTMAVTNVEEPSKYGVVIYNKQDGKIERFVMKPQECDGNKINAGIYILNPSVLERIPVAPASIVQKVNFIRVCMYLSDLVRRHKNTSGGSSLAKGPNISEPVMVHESSRLPHNGTIGPNVVIGANVVMEDGVRIQNSTVLAGTVIKEYSHINSCIIGKKCSVGRWVRIENSVIGDDVVIKDELYLNGARILPHKSIFVNIPEPNIIM